MKCNQAARLLTLCRPAKLKPKPIFASARALNFQVQKYMSTSSGSQPQAPLKGINGHYDRKVRQSLKTREELRTEAKRIVVKVGSAIITHDKGYLSAPRLANIVEEIAHLKQQGRQMLLVSSGAVAFGRKKIRDEVQKSKSIKDTISDRPKTLPRGETRAAAAVGQSSLMSFYENLFHQYDVKVAQVLVTKADFQNVDNRRQLRQTILELLNLDIVPIVNTNDAVEALVTSNLTNGVLDLKHANMSDIVVEDNDSLAAILAVELDSDLLVMLSNVDGIYSGSPKNRDSRLFHHFTPGHNEKGKVEFSDKSNVGLGGMQAKVKSGLWALKKGTSVVICNGGSPGIIGQVMKGERVGTFFTESIDESESSLLADMARRGSSDLTDLGPEGRSAMIREIAESLITEKDVILRENRRDLEIASKDGLENVLLSRLRLTDAKLETLRLGLNQIADLSSNQLGKVLKTTKISDSLVLRKVTCPIGVLLVIYESRPDCLPQISALSIATGNGLILKGGKEAQYSNQCLYNMTKSVLKRYNCHNAIHLVESREKVHELINLQGQIDLIIPRGSNELVTSIKRQSRETPVLGHAEGICHIFIDEDADLDTAVRVAVDSKCNYPSACNAVETILLHKSLVKKDLFAKLCNELKNNQVKVNIGNRLAKELPFYNSGTSDYRREYGDLECLIEVVDSIDDAIYHINRYGSGHTDAIITSNDSSAKVFQSKVDSASVFVNCSTRFADGFRFGLGAEVGISTSKIHARGPAGMESLITYKWIANGSGDTVTEYEVDKTKKYVLEEVEEQKINQH